jgi:hypothetical protein
MERLATTPRGAADREFRNHLDEQPGVELAMILDRAQRRWTPRSGARTTLP